jgi:hypothetical protein
MAEGVVALNLLCANGLFVDMGVIIRCVYDCEAEICFLLEEYPAASPNGGATSSAAAHSLLIGRKSQAFGSDSVF